MRRLKLDDDEWQQTRSFTYKNHETRDLYYEALGFTLGKDAESTDDGAGNFAVHFDRERDFIKFFRYVWQQRRGKRMVQLDW